MGEIWHYSNVVRAVILLGFAGGIAVSVFPKYLKELLFVFGLSFFLYGFHSPSVYSQVFEVLVTVFSLAFLAMGIRERGFEEKNSQLILLILLYICLSLLSLLQLPLGSGFISARLWGFSDFLGQIFTASSGSYLYSIAGVNRLILFFVFALLLSGLSDRTKLYITFCKGILFSAILAALVGLMDYYGLLSLTWFRDLNPSFSVGDTQFRLHSTFGHPGWFAEFATVAIPFILMGFFKKESSVFWKMSLFVVLLVCEIALILAKARAGWISYPLTLVFCWVFFYLFQNKRDTMGLKITRKGILKVAVSIPLTIGISLIIIFSFLGEASVPTEDAREKTGTSRKLQAKLARHSIGHRTEILFRAGDRIFCWGKGIDVGREKPLFGMGYESYRRHDMVLRHIPDSYVGQHPKKSKNIDTPHNLFVQLFVSGGAVGLLFWLLCVGYMGILLVTDVIQNRTFFNLCVLLSVLSFHIYGVFQSMQYIPMIWMMIFICFGYAMTINEKVLPEKVRRATGWVIKAMVVVVLIGGVVYFMGRGSQDLADKYGLKVYAQDQDWHNYLGFYHKEKWGKTFYRWSGKRGMVRTEVTPVESAALSRSVNSTGQGGRPSEIRSTETSSISRGKVVGFDVQCHTPGVEKEPVVVWVSLDGKRIDAIVFRGKGGKTRWYNVGTGQPRLNTPEGTPVQRGKHEFLFEVSRTWNPGKMGVSEDWRDLGVAVSEVKIKEVPEEGAAAP